MVKKIRNNKVLKIIFNTIKIIVSILILLIVLIIFIQKISNNKLNLGGYSIYTIVSESMTPKYEVGDMILVKNVSVDDIRVGDDLVYLGTVGTFNGKIVTHQVIDIKEENGEKVFYTKGLANLMEDPTVNESQVYGIVQSKLVILSLLSKIANNIYGFYFIIFVPFVIMVFIDFIHEIHPKEDRNGKEKE